MYERMTDRARRVIALAQDIAAQTRADVVEPVHLLYGLAAEEDGVAHGALTKLGLQASDIFPSSSWSNPAAVRPRQDDRLAKVMELSLREALQLRQNYISTEHLLLAIVRYDDMTDGSLFQQYRLDPNRVRQQVIQLLADYVPANQPAAEPRQTDLELALAGDEDALLRLLGRLLVGQKSIRQTLIIAQVKQDAGLIRHAVTLVEGDLKAINHASGTALTRDVAIREVDALDRLVRLLAHTRVLASLDDKLTGKVIDLVGKFKAEQLKQLRG